jgi:hypothetical protein
LAKLVLLWDDHQPTYLTNWGEKKQRGVSHGGLAIYIKKYVKAKAEKIMETQIFHHVKIKLIFKKNPLNETKILQDIIITL